MLYEDKKCQKSDLWRSKLEMASRLRRVPVRPTVKTKLMGPNRERVKSFDHIGNKNRIDLRFLKKFAQPTYHITVGAYSMLYEDKKCPKSDLWSSKLEMASRLRRVQVRPTVKMKRMGPNRKRVKSFDHIGNKNGIDLKFQKNLLSQPTI